MEARKVVWRGVIYRGAWVVVGWLLGSDVVVKVASKVKRGVLLLMLTNHGWVDGSGSNPGGGFGKLGGSREIRGGGDRLEGPGGQLSMRWILMELEVVKWIYFKAVVKEFSHLVVPHLMIEVVYEKCGEDVKKMVFEGDDYKGAKEIFPKEKFPSFQLGANVVKVEFVGVSYKLSLSGSKSSDGLFDEVMFRSKEIAIGMTIKRI
uniref:Uncharacterized protein n=1 Tax=Tanacetum cinerariifolium TaxID=118510 RepID=A0A6L2LNF1_TANCI|nr:hypothetical protein [Tanacetum cinerariifolium]